MGDSISATVLLRPASGGTHEGVTAATADRALPDPETAARAQDFFRKAGFEVTAAFGPSFSIGGPRSLFEQFFRTRLEETKARGVQTAEGAYELPLEPLKPDLAASLQAVTFTPPPAFGPTDYA